MKDTWLRETQDNFEHYQDYGFTEAVPGTSLIFGPD